MASSTPTDPPQGAADPPSVASDGAKPRWERRKQERPQEMIAAAFTLFVERGFAATRLEDVAARAGVSKGTLYLYFANKQELFKAVVRESIVPVIDEADAMVEHYQGSSAALFADIMMGWWQRIGATSRAGIAKLVMAEADNFPEIAAFYHDEVIKRGHAMIERLLQRGIERGEFRSVDIAATRNVLMAPMLMLIMWKHSFAPCLAEPIDPAAYLQSFVDFALHGLLVPAVAKADGAP